jgi:2-dehydropantoate 2-reductase
LAAAFRAGVCVEVSPDIRLDIWRKLWGNMSMNPLSALARASTGRLLDDAETRALAGGMMREMAELGASLGLDLGMTPEERMAVTRKLGDFKTSMQRDMEAGRRLELSNLLTVLVEMADRLGQPAPLMRAVHGLARQLDTSLQN